MKTLALLSIFLALPLWAGTKATTCSTTMGGPACSGGPGSVCVNLSWTPDSSGDPVNIFRGTTSGGENFLTPINAKPVSGSTYQDDNLPAGATAVYYEASSVNSQGVQSAPSNEACAQVPVPPQAPGNLQAPPQHD